MYSVYREDGRVSQERETKSSIGRSAVRARNERPGRTRGSDVFKDETGFVVRGEKEGIFGVTFSGTCRCCSS